MTGTLDIEASQPGWVRATDEALKWTPPVATVTWKIQPVNLGVAETGFAAGLCGAGVATFAVISIAFS